MIVCAACGQENPDGFKFCGKCATPLDAAPAPREQRKTVTVLFCDVTGSTALGESTDPEALRALLARYFERMKEIVETHGGTVEKFIGDAVMAVFGVPQVHEDDALRACRAAVEMRDALPELGVEARIGLNTGEVVTGTEERLATGDAVNVAARLEQAAQPGEILIGPETLRLVRDCVEVKAVEPLELKGKAEPVEARRLLEVTDELARRHVAPMVGREAEFAQLRASFEKTVRDRSCQLFTILGSAGVGKSRLAHEFLRELDARVVRGRCLPYGTGITYWAVVEVLKQLDVLPSDRDAAAALRSLLRETEEATTAEQIAWAFRKLLEEQADERPLVCVFDDIHWAEETLLDLIEHVADLSRGSPILLLCLARPELFDKRRGWGGGKLNATTVLLEPLSPEETDALVDGLGGAEPELRARIREASEGNPLFLEEMLALLREPGDDDVRVPPTIQALLAARLDQLDPEDRSVLERGAVEGRVFHRSAVEALAPEASQVSKRLLALVRKELVRPDRTQLPGDDAFRFRHLLIRDAAYDALPKATRAQLHERFAEWLEERGPDLVELDEILGHHLEQAARYRSELGQPDPSLATRAGERLAAAGRRALWRGDDHAASTLLTRALELTRPVRLDVHLELDFADACVWSDPRRAAEIADATAARAAAAGDTRGELLARTVEAHVRMVFTEIEPDVLDGLARAALPLLEEADDHAGLVHVWHALGFGVANIRGRFGDRVEAGKEAIRHSRLAGQRRTDLLALGAGLYYGPHPTDDAVAILDELLPENPHPSLLAWRAVLLAASGRFDDAWPLANRAGQRWRDLSGDDEYFFPQSHIEMLAGDYEAAADHMRVFCDLLEERGQRSFLSTFAPMLGRWLCALGRYEEANPLAEVGRDLGHQDDLVTQTIWRQNRALVDASRGEVRAAEALAREAIEIAERTDALNFQGDAFCDLAEVLRLAGRAEEATSALEQALERYERKKNSAMVAQVRPKLEALLQEARP